jgi:hypothetical protein
MRKFEKVNSINSKILGGLLTELQLSLPDDVFNPLITPFIDPNTGENQFVTADIFYLPIRRPYTEPVIVEYNYNGVTYKATGHMHCENGYLKLSDNKTKQLFPAYIMFRVTMAIDELEEPDYDNEAQEWLDAQYYADNFID